MALILIAALLEPVDCDEDAPFPEPPKVPRLVVAAAPSVPAEPPLVAVAAADEVTFTRVGSLAPQGWSSLDNDQSCPYTLSLANLTGMLQRMCCSDHMSQHIGCCILCR